ncbi:MAG: hypothetical protein ACLTKE_08085 [Coprococcus sp.]
MGILFLCGAFRIYLSGDIVAGSNCGGILVSVVFLTVIWIRPGAFGAGDVKLMAISGLMLGVGEISPHLDLRQR